MMNTKNELKKRLPEPVLDVYRHYRAVFNGWRSAEAVFTQVYGHNLWGGVGESFFSGPGSRTPEVVAAYVGLVQTWLRTVGAEHLVVVDLGCGDFTIGSQLAGLCGGYVGVDVVPGLVQHNQNRFGSERVRFVQLDITKDPLPHGDVCLIRQVLQHLSNREIQRVLAKIAQYRWVLVTEHRPAAGAVVRPNLDIPHGADIRLTRSSGVYLDEPPFSLERDRLSLLQEVGSPDGQGVLQTYLYTPR